MLNGKLHILKLKESNDSVPWATKEALLQGWVQMMQGDVFKVCSLGVVEFLLCTAVCNV